MDADEVFGYCHSCGTRNLLDFRTKWCAQCIGFWYRARKTRTDVPWARSGFEVSP